MEVIKIELPRTLEPHFYCPFSGHNLLGEEMYDALEFGFLTLFVNWSDPDYNVAGSEELVKKYQAFEAKEDEEPTDRVVRFLKYFEMIDSHFIIELTVNAVANGPITEINTIVFSK